MTVLVRQQRGCGSRCIYVRLKFGAALRKVSYRHGKDGNKQMHGAALFVGFMVYGGQSCERLWVRQFGPCCLLPLEAQHHQSIIIHEIIPALWSHLNRWRGVVTYIAVKRARP